jgi:peptidoglycan/xylan/chitin deacetylase (PgdA/CDA1 family)
MSKAGFFKLSLDALSYSGASRILRSLLGGRGAIFMLHHIVPGGGKQEGFAPNAGLEITPEFLDEVIMRVSELGYELLSLETAVNRLKEKKLQGSRFAVFTIDDGYLDNFVHALPVFRRRNCPFTIFVSPAIIDGKCELWWRSLEAIIASTDHLHARMNGSELNFACETLAGKNAVFERLYWPLRSMPETNQRDWIRELSARYGHDTEAYCRTVAMTWDQLRQIADEPLCSIGAHTVHHFALAKLSRAEASEEAVASRERLERELGRPISFFAYPYGDAASAGSREFELIRDLDFSAAVTTEKGLIYDRHHDQLTALPRVSLNGSYQKVRYVDTLLSGAPFALWNSLRPRSST